MLCKYVNSFLHYNTLEETENVDTSLVQTVYIQGRQLWDIVRIEISRLEILSFRETIRWLDLATYPPNHEGFQLI